MDKTAIKNFAVWARVKLMEDIRTRLGLLGITEDGVSDPLSASTNEVKYFDIGADHPVSIKGKAIRQREQLAEEIRKAGKESNYQSAYRNFIESSAYDWFNRLIAIRYMEINEYAPLDVRLLSSVEPGKQDPDLVSTPFDGSLEYSESETQQILAWKEQHDNNKLFRFLLFKMCNRLHEVLPGIFEARDDASELLMRQSFIDKDGIIHHLVNDIPEEDWKDQVQIIGWIYQYYNSELKAEVFAKKEKVTKDELPAVTQLFTPDWIVRYMVENSLGRLWIEHLRGLNPDVDEKETAEKFGWKYYLPEAKQEPEVEQQLAKIREEYATLKPEDLSCLDPCMGSGHILVYMFDVLEQIYTSVGYSEREAAKAILENNIYGLDIDDRAYQLAYFAVMMKARQYSRRILTSGIKAHVYSIQESNDITINQLQEMGENLSPEEKTKALSQAEKLVELFHDAKEYGSILNIPEMDWDLLRRFATPKETLGQTSLNWNQEASEKLMQLINQGEVMSKKYWVTCTNPPYLALSSADMKLYSYLSKYFPDAKNDLFAAFIKLCNSLLKSNGIQSIITQHSWMFLSRSKELREKIINQTTILSLVHLGTRAFDAIGGEVVQTVAFCIRNQKQNCYNGTYIKLVDYYGESKKKEAYFDKNNYYSVSSTIFHNVPDSMIVFWQPKQFIENFKSRLLGNVINTRVGLDTGNNDKYIRTWEEINYGRIEFSASTEKDLIGRKKWVPHTKGGQYRKWYGNFEEELNRIFIDIYGLQDELTPEEDDKDVTVRKADLGRDIRSLISYAIGCMFGRYSLDKEGLIYAGGDWKSVQDVYKTFLPDQDNVIPITDQKYLDDDVVERICEFLTVVYGAETLDENLDFIAKALGNKGLTSREVIRNYMLSDFFKDHCKTYSVTGSGKRPIYWLFDSGKENAFKALVYMHRWDADTTGRVLLYAQQIQQKYETEIRAIDMMLDHITDARQKSTEEKRQEHLKKQLEELVDYEERLEHMANERIAIDLDDGVKVNYEKVQTDRNGKKYQILAPIK